MLLGVLSGILPQSSAYAASGYLADEIGNTEISIDVEDTVQIVLWLVDVSEMAGYDCAITVSGPGTAVDTAAYGDWFADGHTVTAGGGATATYSSAMLSNPTYISGSGDLVVFTIRGDDDGVVAINIDEDIFCLGDKDAQKIVITTPSTLYITVGTGGGDSQSGGSEESTEDSSSGGDSGSGLLDAITYDLKVKSEPATGAEITGDEGGIACYIIQVDENELVSIAAPETHDGRTFYRWIRNNAEQTEDQRTLEFDMTGPTLAIADYNRKLQVSSMPLSEVEIDGDHGGTTPYALELDALTVLDIAAPEQTTDGRNFSKWIINGTANGNRDPYVELTADTIAVAEYNRIIGLRSSPYYGVLITTQINTGSPHDYETSATFGLQAGFNDSLKLTAPIAHYDETYQVWLAFLRWDVYNPGTSEYEPYSIDNEIAFPVTQDVTLKAVYTPNASDVKWVSTEYNENPEPSGAHDDPFNVIQEAIGACPNDGGDYVVIVMPGSYEESEIDFGGARATGSLTVRALFPYDSESASTIGSEPARTFIFANGEGNNCSVIGFIITQGGIRCGRDDQDNFTEASSPTILRNKFINCPANNIESTFSSPRIWDNEILGDGVEDATGIACEGGEPDIRRNTIEWCSKGGIRCVDFVSTEPPIRSACSATIVSNTIKSNSYGAPVQVGANPYYGGCGILWASTLGTGYELTPVSATVRIDNNEILSNYADGAGLFFRGAGICCYYLYKPGEDPVTQTVEITGNIVKDSTISTGSYGYGAGIAALDTKGAPPHLIVRLQDNWIEHNVITNYHPGQIDEDEFTDAAGAGVHLENCVVALKENRMVSNSIQGPLDEGGAAGIALEGGKMDPDNSVIEMNTIDKNTSSGHCGGIFVKSVDDSGGPVLLHANRILDNNCSQGAGILIDGTDTELKSNCIADNIAQGFENEEDHVNAYGAGLYARYSHVTLINNTFANNIAQAGGDRSPAYGGAVCLSQSSCTIRNCIFWGNRTKLDGENIKRGAQIYASATGPQELIVYYSDIEDDDDNNVDKLFLDGSYWTLDWDGSNINVNPIFVTAKDENYLYSIAVSEALHESRSPCLDAGQNAVVPVGEKDILNKQRRMDSRNPDVAEADATVDMGAYEMSGQEKYIWPTPGDCTWDCRVNILDLIYIRNKLGLNPAAGLNWRADTNKDNVINILDLLYVRNWLNTQCQ